MAEMYPKTMNDAELDELIPTDGSEAGAEGENILYRLMKKHLPDDWCVIWNRKLITPEHEHQYDFIVLAKDLGVLVLDAKGHKVGYNENGVLGRWRRGVFSPDPYMFDHVKSASEHLRREILVPNVGAAVACNCLVAFIDQLIGTRGGADAMQPDGEGWIDRLEDRLQDDPDCLRRRIVDRLSARIGGADLSLMHRNFTPKVMRQVKEMFCKQNGWEIYFQDDFYKWECKAHDYLSTRQSVAFDSAMDVDAIHVKGAAGTGKTILAMSLARQYARDGKSVLYICYNRNLASRQASLLKQSGWRNIVVSTYDAVGSVALPGIGKTVSFVMNWPKVNRIGWTNAQYQAERENIRRRLNDKDAQAKLGLFDILLVDEAQDLDNKYIYTLLRFLRPEGKIFVFSDEGQAIYTKSGWTFDAAKIFAGRKCDEILLSENWRNAKQIHLHYRELGCDLSTPCFRGKIDPQSLLRTDVPAKLESLLADGRRPKNIALLSIAGADMSKFCQVHKRNGGVSAPVQIADSLERWYSDGCILKTSVESFKGLEADIVIIFGDRELEYGSDDAKAQRTMDRYVGESRAKYELYIVDE